MKKMKKIINVLLASVFLMTTVQASQEIIGEAMQNITTVHSYTEADGTQNFYTPSASIRFNTVVNPGPLFSFTPPSIEAGCSGIDIKGMFMSIIGGDELTDLFTDVSTSFAWGIALGIIYSLPGVANAFKFINGWAKKLQDLLAQACSAGIEIGQWAADKANIDELGFSQQIDGFLSELDPKKYLKAKKKGHNGLLEAMGWYSGPGAEVDQLSDEDKLEAVAALLRGIFESDASMFAGIFADIAKKAPSGRIESIVGIPTSSPSGDAVIEKEFSLTQSNVSSLAGAIDGGGALTAVSQAKLSLFSYVLIYNFVGDIGIATPPASSLPDLFKGATSNGEAAKDQYEQLKQHNYSKLKFIAGITGMASNKEKGAALAKFIWYGTTTTSNPKLGATTIDNRQKNAKIYAPKLKIYTIREKNTAGKSAFIPVMPSSQEDHEAYYSNATYKGTIMNSKCVIDELVAGDGNVTSSACDGSIEFPQIHKYIKIIKDSPLADQFSLKHALTQIMAVKMAEAILGSISESLGHIQTSTGGAISQTGENTPSGATAKENAELVLNYRKQISEVQGYAWEYLGKNLGEEFENAAKVDTLFMIQDRKNRERGLKSLQK